MMHPYIRKKISIAKKGRANPSVSGRRNGRAKMSERMRVTGGGNPNAKKPLVHGTTYETLQAAAMALGVAQGTTIRKRIDRGVPGYGWACTSAYLKFTRLKKGTQVSLPDL